MNDFKLAPDIRSRGEPPLPARRLRARAQARRRSTRRSSSSRVAPEADRESVFPVDVAAFDDDDDEMRVAHRRHRARSRRARPRLGRRRAALPQHEIGERLEAAFLNAGIPCRLAQGRALADDPVVAYVIAALRVIAQPERRRLRDAVLRVVLPRAAVRRSARPGRGEPRTTLRPPARAHGSIALPARTRRGRQHPPRARRLAQPRRARQAHTTLGVARAGTVVAARRQAALGARRPPRRDQRSGGASRRRRARRPSRAARETRKPTSWMPRMGGVEIALKAMLAAIGFTAVDAGRRRRRTDAECDRGRRRRRRPASRSACSRRRSCSRWPTRRRRSRTSPRSTSRRPTTIRRTARSSRSPPCACATARSSRRFSSLVKPRVPIAPAATATHGISEADVASAPYFEEIWPAFRAFCGDDVVVAHNGYEFDFRILARMAPAIGDERSISARTTRCRSRAISFRRAASSSISRASSASHGPSHRALDDTVALAQRRARARRA